MKNPFHRLGPPEGPRPSFVASRVGSDKLGWAPQVRRSVAGVLAKLYPPAVSEKSVEFPRGTEL